MSRLSLEVLRGVLLFSVILNILSAFILYKLMGLFFDSNKILMSFAFVGFMIPVALGAYVHSCIENYNNGVGDLKVILLIIIASCVASLSFHAAYYFGGSTILGVFVGFVGFIGAIVVIPPFIFKTK